MAQSKNIGIWGLGIVGSSLVRFLSKQGVMLGVMDRKTLSETDRTFLAEHNARFYPEADKEAFFAQHDHIIPSGGIDVRPYPQYAHKWLSELDLFAAHTTTPIVGITGTIGKTSITHLFSEILKIAGKHVVTGGNIGVGLVDLLEQPTDLIVLELSSFQLDLAHSFAPQLAIITNIFPNHIDRHGTFDAYVDAKYKLIGHQQHNALALASIELYDLITQRQPQSTCAFFAASRPTQADTTNHVFYYFDDQDNIIREERGQQKVLAHAKALPDLSYRINWLTICAALDQLGITMPDLTDVHLAIPDHRLQCIATINGIDFYDDSKSTIPEATKAALEKLSSRPTIALIGGISKGVDRTPLFAAIKPHVKAVVCFGGEGTQLHEAALQSGLTSFVTPTLQDAVNIAFKQAQPGDQIVLSPAGASFDLFANYHARGAAFKECVAQLHMQN